jgi:hypothetical protein
MVMKTLAAFTFAGTAGVAAVALIHIGLQVRTSHFFLPPFFVEFFKH